MDNGNELYDKEYLEFYDCNKLAKMIKIYLSLIKTMQLELGDINSIKITPLGMLVKKVQLIKLNSSLNQKN